MSNPPRHSPVAGVVNLPKRCLPGAPNQKLCSRKVSPEDNVMEIILGVSIRHKKLTSRAE